MYRPTTRVLTVLELLQAHAQMSGAELAHRLEVDGRTVRRYISALEDLGIPVTAERGRNGGYMLVAGFKLPPLMFTDDETLAVSLGLLAARSLGLAEAAPAVESARAKLERVMPVNLKRRVRAVSETATLDLSQNGVPGDNAALVALSSAAQERRRVCLRYRAANGKVSVRDFDTYGLVYRQGNWYATGMCHLRGGLRSFRLDRIADVQEREAGFERPDGFDAAQHLAYSIATIPRAFTVEVLLHTDLKTALEALRESMGLFDVRDGAVLLRSHTDSLDWFARQLARLPFDFEIRKPAELSDALRACANRLLRLAM